MCDMKEVSKEVLELSADKLMFDLSDEQYDHLLHEFDLIISQMHLLDDIEGVDDVEPMTFPFDVTNTYLRDDVAGEPLNREEALKNSKDVLNGQIKLPRIVK